MHKLLSLTALSLLSVFCLGQETAKKVATTVHSKKRIEQVAINLDSIKLDSLKTLVNDTLPNPTKQLNEKIQSFESRINTTKQSMEDSVDSIGKRISLVNVLQSPTDSLQFKQKQVSDKISGWQTSSQNKLDQVTESGKDEISDALSNVSGVPVSNGPSGTLEPLQETLEPIQLESLQPLDEFSMDEIIEQPLQEVKSVGILDEFSAEIQGLDKVQQQVGGLQENLEEVKQGDLSGVEKKVEQQIAANVSELGDLQKEMGAAEAMIDAKIAEYKPHLDREMLASKLSDLAKNTPERYQKISEAYTKTTGLKQKYERVNSLKNVKKEKHFQLAGLPWYSRFRVGTDMEVARNQDVTALDVAPYLGFTISKRLAIQTGYLWRYDLNTKKSFKADREDVSSMRVNANYKFFKGIRLLAGYERMSGNGNLDPVNGSVKDFNGLFVGIYKQYTIAKGVYGHAQLLFNALHHTGSIYNHPVNIRFGFYFNKTARTSGADNRE